MKRPIIVLSLITLIIAFTPSIAQQEIVRLDDIEPEEVAMAGFRLDSEQELQIEAIGAHRRFRHHSVSNAWILNADNREVVWELTDANSSWKNRKLREYKDKLTLPSGRYEIYYAVFPGWVSDDSWSITRFFFKDRRYDYDDSAFEEFYISVKGSGVAMSADQVRDYQKKVQKRAALTLLADKDDCYLKQGFTLKRETDLVVYSVGEVREDGSYDYGWILDTQTRKPVWKFEFRGSEFGGGSEKNRVVRETISLPAGNYAAFYVSDDSHSPREWNAPPPFDPAFWGLSIYAKDNRDAGNIALFDYEDIPGKNVIVDFSRMRDDEYVSKGFTLKKDMPLRIYAIGEGLHGDMFDYGWIVDAKTGRTVWEMNYRDSEHAGGNNKNRLVDKVIKLDKGSYIAYFTTDDSHSYSDWNASPPFDREHWGMTIIAMDKNFNPRDVSSYEQEDDPSIIARIAPVRDWEDSQTKFSLKKDSEVRIYALGEGSDGEMFDYAWIEDANTGKVVWEMTYRKTDHAGGARKNRVFDDTILLKAGDYILRYESDDSHAFKDWNDSPPRDQGNYGVTLYADGK